MKKYVFLVLSATLIFTNCKKNDDDAGGDEQMSAVKSVADYPVQDFMWLAMNTFYFWQADVADLDDSKINNEADYAEFLSAKADPEEFFFNICYKHRNIVGDDAAVDRFSFLSENYEDLVQRFQGVSKSNGLDFNLYLFSNSDDIYGVVNYVANDSDASTTNIKRGDLFTGVNGQTLNRTNYLDLLFGDEDTYSLNLAQISNGEVVTNGATVSLTKVENFVESPILVSKVIEENGTKVGYLMYNSFIANFDEQLNTVFGDFKAAGVNEVVLDFRYNGGGRVSSAVQIASSIFGDGSNTDDVFLRPRFNSKLQAGNGDPTFFTSTTINGTAINALNLSKVYVITTESTASASELVINGLAPYVEVIQIGSTTRGKNEFSVTFVDDPENNYFYDADRENEINPENQWAIQPLLGRNENADGFSDYTSGLVPNNFLEEDIANLGVLGERSDPLLNLALDLINGQSGKTNFNLIFPPTEFVNSTSSMKVTNNSSVMDGLLKPTAFLINQK